MKRLLTLTASLIMAAMRSGERPARGSPSRSASGKLRRSTENEASLSSPALRLGEPRAAGVPVLSLQTIRKPKMRIAVTLIGSLLLAALGSQAPSMAWDYEGHRLINQLALASLPTNFPAFATTHAARERIAFLSGEPDRWRNTPDLPFKHSNGPDHYTDLEELAIYELEPASLPAFRYDFAAQLARARAAHPERFPAIDPAKDADHTRALIGFLPWTITEDYAKLKSGFLYLKALE